MNLQHDCTLERFTADSIIDHFDCGNDDLNDFLHSDALPYAEKLLGVTYVFTLDSAPTTPVCFFTVSNDGLKVTHYTPNAKRKLEKQIPHIKKLKTYPAVKIGRLGVALPFQGTPDKIGNQLMDFIKGWFIEGNKTGCRFLLVDAYNEEKVLKYYQRNGFDFLLTIEAETQKDKEGNPKPLNTRLMFFDLINR